MPVTTTYAPEQTVSASTPTSIVGGRHVLGLDLIRFIAALLVLAFHLAWLNRMYHLGSAYNYNFAYLDPFTKHGWVGVDIFFTLSGFVIAYSAQKASPLGFVESRFLRLYPAAWICSTVTLFALIASVGFHPYLLRIWANALTLAPTGRLIDPSYWTLGIEISFYFVIFALLAARRFVLIGPVLTVIAALSTACLSYAFALQHNWSSSTQFSSRFVEFFSTRWAQLLLLQHGSLFALGSLLWLWLCQGRTRSRGVAIALCLPGCLLAIRNDWQMVVHQAGVTFSPAPAVCLWMVATVALIASVVHNAFLSGIFGKRGAKLIRALGLMTYPLYLIHQQAGFVFMSALHGKVPDLLLLLVTAALAIGFAWLSVRLAEQPLQARLRHSLRALRGPSREPASTLP